MLLEPDSSTPLYIQIKNILQMRIQTGNYTVGARLPSERDLAQQFNVSRMTARQALQSLANEGFVHFRVGKGTYVSPMEIDQDLDVLTSFCEEMHERGVEPTSRVLIADVQPATQEIATHLEIFPGTEIVVLKRIRLANDQPMAIETAHQIINSVAIY